ncbi:DUF488 domain-containing protein [Corynebacterium sp.]|uniref:DUF488 domain-containing protein n=1 Tax=Corynebacterium sp. TaxID=1720 RepID=UPI0026DA7FEC|nr:DUF488 family protein [Corynebacterium sp.]MDO5032056.1 DUF488 family protein [Corynebacterium sp.]
MIYTAKVHDLIKGEDAPHGTVVLVDRLWPRGVSKEDFHYDHWLKDVAPSPGLRKWWNHDADSFEEFSRRYRAELDEAGDDGDVATLAQLARANLTLCFAAKDREINHATVLKAWLEERS